MPGQKIPKATVAACDVHILAVFVRDPGELSDPTVQVVENHQAQKVQVHDWKDKGTYVYSLLAVLTKWTE